jgi:hypothetical protein
MTLPEGFTPVNVGQAAEHVADAHKEIGAAIHGHAKRHHQGREEQRAELARQLALAEGAERAAAQLRADSRQNRDGQAWLLDRDLESQPDRPGVCHDL